MIFYVLSKQRFANRLGFAAFSSSVNQKVIERITKCNPFTISGFKLKTISLFLLLLFI